MTKEQKIKEFLENELSDGELVEVWNDYCDRNNMGDDQIYPIEYFDDYYQNFTPTEIALRIFNFTHFNPNERWFTFDGLGNPKTFDYVDAEIDTEAIADFAVECNYAFGIREIAVIIEDSES